MDYTYILQLKKEIDYSLKTETITEVMSNIDIWIKKYEKAKEIKDTNSMASIASNLASYRLTLSLNLNSFIQEDKNPYSEDIELSGKGKVLVHTNTNDIIKYDGVEYKLKQKIIDIDEQKVYLTLDTGNLLKEQHTRLLKELKTKFEPYKSLIEVILKDRIV